MDPTSVASEVLDPSFGYASNKHLYDWLTENERHEEMRQTLYREVDRQYASKQTKVNNRKSELADIYDSVERTFERRAIINSIEGAGWDEDYLSNETDPQLKLPQGEAVVENTTENQMEIDAPMDATTDEGDLNGVSMITPEDTSPLESFY